MKRVALALLTCLLLMFSSVVSSSRTQEGPPTPQQIKECQKECKATYKDCVKSGGDEPLCEAAEAFCEECCTGGCRAGE
jgi:hypothetical protein